VGITLQYILTQNKANNQGMMLLNKYTLATIMACICLTLNAQTDAVVVRQRDSITSLISQTTDAATLARLYNTLAYKQLALSDSNKMTRAAERSLYYANKQGLKDLIYDNNLLLARVYCNLNAPEEALHRYLAAQSALDRKTTEGIVADADINTEIGLLYFGRKHYKRAEVDFNDALEVYKEHNLQDKTMQNVRHIAVCNYLTGDYEKSAEYYQQLLDYYQKGNDIEAEKQTMRRLADIYQKLKQYGKALQINNDLVDICSDDGDMPMYYNTLNNVAYCQILSGKIDDGMDIFLTITDSDEHHNANPSQLAGAYTNIGLSYQNMGKNKECYDYLSRAAEIRKNLGQDNEYSQVNNILSLVYLKNKDIHNAELCCKEAVDAAEKCGDPQLRTDAYQTYNQVLQAKGEYDNALKYYQQYLNLRDSAQMRQVLDNKALEDDLRNLVDAEKRWTDEIVDAEITDLTNRQLQAETMAKERENELLTQEVKLKEMEQNRLKQQLALQEQQRLALIRENEIKDLQAKQLMADAELRQKQAEEKERKNQIELLESQKKQQQSELVAQKARERQLYLFLVLGGVMLAGMLLIFVIVRRKNRVLNEQKKEIEEMNADLLTKNEEITLQKENLQMANDEIILMNDEITAQKDMLEHKNKSITDSIVYAQRIQQAVCPLPDFLRDFNFDFFMFFQPKEIVSGDFYWFYKEGDIVFAVAADCTGHGVPGAFMSMLGNSLLNKIISERKIFEPSKILNILRDEVKKALHQEDLRSERKDGMDMSLAKIDTKTLMLEFAAANNNAYIVRHFGKDEKALAETDMVPKDMIKEVADGYLRLKVLIADMMPIGVYIRDHISFKSQQIQLRHGDTIYMTSDGYIDQFGGKNGTKFMSKNFKEMLLEIYPLPMTEQYDKTVNTHNEWKAGKYPQIDDIIVFGLKIL